MCTEHVTWRNPPRSSLQYPAKDEAIAVIVVGMIRAAEVLQEDDISTKEP